MGVYPNINCQLIIDDSVDLVRKTLPKVFDVTKYSVYKNNHYQILMFLFDKTFGMVLFQQNYCELIISESTWRLTCLIQ